MKSLFRNAAIVALIFVAGPALAHVGADHAQHHALAGFLHPFFGFDHMLAMIAIGLCATMWGGHLRWSLPLTFLGAMLAGFMIGTTGFAVLPAHEAMILASVISLGLALAVARPLPASLAIMATAFFGVAHGFAHGIEGFASAAYAGGFLAATAILHGIGLAAGVLGHRLEIPLFYRAAGSALTLAGIAIAAS